MAAGFLALVVAPRLADQVGMANAFKRARGWAETTDLVLSRASDSLSHRPGFAVRQLDEDGRLKRIAGCPSDVVQPPR